MTAVEMFSALWHGLRVVSALQGLPWWRKLQLGFLKVVAIVGYHTGKMFASNEASKGKDTDISRATEVEVHELGGQGDYDSGGSEKHRLMKVAVVVPVYATVQDNVKLLLYMLRGLVSQRRKVDLLIVVDDASPLPLPSFAMNSSAQCIVFRLHQNCGPAVARNTGVKVARMHGVDLVCFLDADCLPHRDWLYLMEQSQLQRPGIVCGRTLATRPDTAIGLFHDICGTLNGRVLPDGSILYGCTCNLSIHTRSIPLLFDTNFPDAAFEDVEFCVRARKKGMQLSVNKDAIVHHHYVGDIAGLFRQFRRYGRNEDLMGKLHKEYMQWLWSSSEMPSFAEGIADTGYQPIFIQTLVRRSAMASGH